VYEQIDGVVCNDKPVYYRLESHDYVLYQRSNSTQWAVGSLDRPHDCAGTSEGVLLYVKTCPHSAVPICEGQWEHWTGSEWQDDAVAVARVGCRECPVGQQQPSSGGPNCTYCSSGTFADTVASAVCRSCPRGYFTSDDVFDTDGTGVSSGAVACNECPIGTFNQLSGATCSTCSPIPNAASVVCTNDTTSQVLMCSVGYHNATMHICQRKRAHFTVHLYCNMLRNMPLTDNVRAPGQLAYRRPVARSTRRCVRAGKPGTSRAPLHDKAIIFRMESSKVGHTHQSIVLPYSASTHC
jgi:hypothetical protein